MKKINIKISAILLLFLLGIAFVFYSCEEEESFPRTRLFRPVLSEDLYSIGNTIIVDMGKLKDAVSYTVEVSRDTFNTVEYTIETDSNVVVINKELVGEELLWFTIYQVRATAHANDSQYDSKISDLGNVRTQKFPSNQGTPTEFDVTDTRARVFWTPSGATIDGIKVFAINDLRLEDPISEMDLTTEQQAANEAIVTGLTPETSYQIAIYSGGVLRGWEIYTTKPALISGDNVIDLTGIDNESILADTLPDVAGGSIILLEGGRTYETGGYDFDKSITIRSGYSFTPAYPLIDCSSNFNLSDGSSIDSLVFINIAFAGDFGGNYVFNIDKSGTIGEIKYDACQMHSLRGITRIKGGEGSLGKFTIVNSVADSINGYGILTMDVNAPGWTVDDVLLENSTFSKIIYFLVSRTNANSVVIESCTINEAPEIGRQMFRWRGGDGNDQVFNGIKINNTIWGHGWDTSESGDYGVDGFDGTLSFNVINSYSTSLFSFAAGKDEIPGFPIGNYTGTATDLWADPYLGLDFTIIDNGFAGKSSAGDPRWRVGL